MKFIVVLCLIIALGAVLDCVSAGVMQSNSGVWTTDEKVGNIPVGEGSASAIVGDYIYVFGGSQNKDFTVYRLDLTDEHMESSKWEVVKHGGISPAPRYKLTSAASIGHDIFLFGGSSIDDSTDIKNYAIKYCTHKNEFSVVNATGAPDFIDQCKMPRVASYKDDSLFLFCSLDVFQPNMTLYQFNKESNAFTSRIFPKTHLIGSPMYYYNEAIYFFGGVNPDLTMSNELIKLDLESMTIKSVKANEPGYDTQGCLFLQDPILYIVSGDPKEDGSLGLYSMSLTSNEVSEVKNIRPEVAPAFRKSPICGGLQNVFYFNLAAGYSKEGKPIQDTWTFHLLQ